MWYKFYASHGPGHQSKSEEYNWYDDGDISKEVLYDDWREWCSEEDFDWPRGSVNLVEKLPDKIKNEKIRDYEDQITYAIHMLDILENE